jgi:hypothetical protein
MVGLVGVVTLDPGVTEPIPVAGMGLALAQAAVSKTASVGATSQVRRVGRGIG